MLGELLRHLLRYAQGLSEENRADYAAAIDEAFPPEPEPEPEHSSF